LVLGICDFRHKTPRQSRITLTWPKGPGFSGQNKQMFSTPSRNSKIPNYKSE